MSTHNTVPNGVAPDWYPDPQNPSQQRYWDGATWTQYVRPATGPAAYAPAAPAYLPVTTRSASNGLSIAAMILGALAFLIFPPLFGTIGLILGGVAKSKGEPMADRALLVSGLGLVLGMALGALIFTA